MRVRGDTMDTSKIIRLLSWLCVPLIVIQWYFKMVWLKLDYSGLEHICWLSLLYFGAYAFAFRSSTWYGRYLPMWMIWLLLNGVMVLTLGNINVLLSIDLWVNLLLSLYLKYTQQ